MKTTVVNKRENEKVPFLRGILIRSLLDAGLSFEQAYAIATTVREGLASTKSITSEELQERVVLLLTNQVDKECVEQYRSPSAVPSRILVSNMSGVQSAFSRGRHARYLQSTGMKAEKAEHTTELIYAQLISAGVSSVTTCELGYLTYLCLLQEVGKKAAKRYVVWSEFQRSSKPLVLLIGGTVAAGKSTIATEVAHLLEIVRIQSTDMLREVMRMMVPKRLLPVLHTSSFKAWKTLPIQDTEDRDWDQLVAEGYRAQAELLAVSCEAILQRAVEESVPVILEGVHIHPGLLENSLNDSDVIKVHVMLAVLKSKKLKSRLRGRGAEVPQRRAERYLNGIEAIWSLQSYLLSEADRYDVPIITTEDREKAILQIIQQVNAELARHFSGSAAQVFGPVVNELGTGAESTPWQQIVSSLRGGSAFA